jgi:hypothetical protein
VPQGLRPTNQSWIVRASLHDGISKRCRIGRQKLDLNIPGLAPPGHSIGAGSLPWQIAAQRRRGLCAVADATAGSALDGGHVRRRRSCYASQTTTHEKRTPPGVGRRAVSALRGRARLSRRPGRGQAPAHSPLRFWPWWSFHLPHLTHSVFGTSRPSLLVPARTEGSVRGVPKSHK